MARKTPRKPSKASIKAAADRAEKRAKGEEVEAAPTVLDPPETAKHPGGRPTEYKPEFCDVAVSACARGATIAELAEMLSVYRSTIYRWMAEHQEFSDAIRIAREIADERVGFSLYERAVGYTFDSVKILQDKGVPVIVPFKEHVPPDVAAAKFWLTNRQPAQWREVSRHEHSGPDGKPIEIDQKGEIEQARRVAFALGRAHERQKLKVIDAAG
jgi:hypothetical protein